MLTNLIFNTTPLVVHAHGRHSHKPHWQAIKDQFFCSPRQEFGAIEDLTILTWNNGHEAMGMLEKSLDHIGVPYLVKGQGISDWINSKHKPQLTLEALGAIKTKYVLGVDSRDAIILGDPREIVYRFEQHFACEMVFGADRLNWPNLNLFKEFEDSIPGAKDSEFRYLNGGGWIGKTDFCRAFFAAAVRTEPVKGALDSEQGILKQLFKEYYPEVQLDYRCEIFQNLGFVFTTIFQLG